MSRDDFDDPARAPASTPDEADDAARFAVEARRRFQWSDAEVDYLLGCIGIARAKAVAAHLARAT